jgi:tRNA1Val (adenine37-N6)-methyltransferase
MNTDVDITCDVIGDGALEILQHRRGYRFGLDALLLASDLPELGESAHVVELGAAHGAVSLWIAHQHPSARVVAVERQPSLVDLLEANIERNDLAERVEAIEGDVRDFRELLEPHWADLVVCNPPYYRRGERRPSQKPQRAAAHHELHGTLDDFVDAARYALDQRGRLKIIIPPLRLADLMATTAQGDLTVESLRFFHSRVDTDAYLVEALLRRGGSPDVRVRPPLYIYKNADDYSDEVARRIGKSSQCIT